METNKVERQLYEFVKASEELPDKSEMYFCKCTITEAAGEDEMWTTHDVMQISFYTYTLKQWHVDSKRMKVVEWLKPIPGLKPIKDVELEKLAQDYAKKISEQEEHYIESDSYYAVIDFKAGYRAKEREIKSNKEEKK